MLILLIPLAVLEVDSERLNSIRHIAVTALGGTLPYIAIAVLAIAYLKASGAESLVARAFECRETHMIVLATVFGGVASF